MLSKHNLQPATLTPKQVATILQISPNHVYQQCEVYRLQKSEGVACPKGIPNFKLGACVRIPISAIQSVLAGREVTLSSD